MNRTVPSMVVLGLLLLSIPASWAAEASKEQAKAVAEIEKIGGKVAFDEESPDKPVIGVDLMGNTKLTDAGLKSPKGLDTLQSLDLGHTGVTDAGLKHLGGLTNLQSLGLGFTGVTDAGLEHLKGLAKLRILRLSRTRVTDAGAKAIEKAIPGVQVIR